MKHVWYTAWSMTSVADSRLKREVTDLYDDMFAPFLGEYSTAEEHTRNATLIYLNLMQKYLRYLIWSGTKNAGGINYLESLDVLRSNIILNWDTFEIQSS